MTPIEDAKGLGPVTSSKLASVGITTLEKLIEIGWEEALITLTEHYPEHINVNCAYGLIAAIQNIDWRTLSESEKQQAKNFVKKLKLGI